MSKPAIKQAWAKLPIEVLRRSRPDVPPAKVAHTSAVHSILDLYKRQLLPGSRCTAIINTMTFHLDKSLQWPQLIAFYQLGTRRKLERVSLSFFCSETLVDATTRTLYGDGIYKIDPQMTRHLVTFAEDAWMLIFKYPHGPRSKLSIARRHLSDAFVNYIQGSCELRDGQSWVVETTLNEQQTMDITDADRAALLLMIYYG